MSDIHPIQYYKPNEQFETSSVIQLSSVDEDFVWAGRTLTAFVDQDGKRYDVDDYSKHLSVTFSSLESYLSGIWKLNTVPITLSSMISGETTVSCGVLSCIWNNLDDYKPLTNPESGEFTLSGGEMKSIRYYGSTLSIQLVGDKKHRPVQFKFFHTSDNQWKDITPVSSICDIGNLYSKTEPLSVFAEWVDDFYIVEIEDRMYMWKVDVISKEFNVVKLEDDTIKWIVYYLERKQFYTITEEEDYIKWLVTFLTKKSFNKVELEQNSSKFKYNVLPKKSFNSINLETISERFILKQKIANGET